MIWPALTRSPSSISSSTILAVILDATLAWRRATTYPDASRMEPAAAAPSPAIDRAAAICTGTAPGRVHHQAAAAAITTIAAATPSQILPLPDGTDAFPRSMRSWLSRADLSSMRICVCAVAIPGAHQNIKPRRDANTRAITRTANYGIYLDICAEKRVLEGRAQSARLQLTRFTNK